MPHNERSILPPRRGHGREAVFSAALAAFAEHGYNGASVRQIAAAAGVSISVIYHHYGNKQDLLYEIITDGTSALADSLAAALKVSPPGPEPQFAAVVGSMAKFYTDRTLECRITNTEMRYLSAQNFERHLQLRRQVQSIFDTLVSEGCAADVFRVQNQKIAVRAIVVLCRDIAGWFDPSGKWTAEEVVDHYVRMAFDIVEVSAPPAVGAKDRSSKPKLVKGKRSSPSRDDQRK